MKIKFCINILLTLLFSLSPCFNYSFAQTGTDSLEKLILLKDSLFWIAYNNCDVGAMKQFFTDDVEFYHDRGGLTKGLQDLTAGIEKNLCGNDNFKLRREAVEGTVEVFPLTGSGVIYGAIISGEHVFYVIERGKEERLDGLAKFAQIWILKDGTWKMSRVLSYDHGPANRK